MNHNELIGKTVEDAILYADKIGFIINVTRDDEGVYLTSCDYNPSRLNLKTKDGLIKSVTTG